MQTKQHAMKKKRTLIQMKEDLQGTVFFVAEGF